MVWPTGGSAPYKPSPWPDLEVFSCPPTRNGKGAILPDQQLKETNMDSRLMCAQLRPLYGGLGGRDSELDQQGAVVGLHPFLVDTTQSADPAFAGCGYRCSRGTTQPSDFTAIRHTFATSDEIAFPTKRRVPEIPTHPVSETDPVPRVTARIATEFGPGAGRSAR